ncbi:hypothetical protein MKX01_035104 [Papaver californicum]|nr:hypothetical protein MKX01_035104 [Papaver californicum]
MVRFEVEDPTGSTVFEKATTAVLSGYSHILHRHLDLQITLNSYNTTQKVVTSFTVTRIDLNKVPPKPGANKGISTTIKVERNSDTTDEPPAKKAHIDEI